MPGRGVSLSFCPKTEIQGTGNAFPGIFPGRQAISHGGFAKGSFPNSGDRLPAGFLQTAASDITESKVLWHKAAGVCRKMTLFSPSE